MSDKQYRSFGEKLAVHTAPTLLGIKCGSMVSLSCKEHDITENMRIFNERAGSRGLKIKSLGMVNCRSLLLIYSEKLLGARLSDSAVRRVLSEYGYSYELGMEDCIEHLSERIAEHSSFPHEIGVFLGYPLEDIKGFIENKGANYKLCGAWKVYGSEETARRAFTNYEKCRKFLCNKLNQGNDIYQALKIS